VPPLIVNQAIIIYQCYFMVGAMILYTFSYLILLIIAVINHILFCWALQG